MDLTDEQREQVRARLEEMSSDEQFEMVVNAKALEALAELGLLLNDPVMGYRLSEKGRRLWIPLCSMGAFEVANMLKGIPTGRDKEFMDALGNVMSMSIRALSIRFVADEVRGPRRALVVARTYVTDENDPPGADALIRLCSRCDRKLWIHPQSLEVNELGADLVCIECASKVWDPDEGVEVIRPEDAGFYAKTYGAFTSENV